MNNSVTIQDVADQAGVAASTASDALNGKSHVAEDTRLKVVRAAEELDYKPHPGARHLSSGVAQQLGLFIPASRKHVFSSTGFFNKLVQGIHEAVDGTDFSLSLRMSETESDARQKLRSVLDSRTLGGLILTHPTEDSDLIELLEKSGLPHVVLGRPKSEALYVDNDNVEVGEIATRHLIDHAQGRVAFLSGPSKFTYTEDRLEGYQSALEEAGLSYDDELVWNSELVESAAYDVVYEKAKTHQFGGIFVSGDVQAVGAVHALRDLDKEVPGDVSLVSVCNSQLTKHFDPSITTVDLHEYWLGNWAAKRLIQEIEGTGRDRPKVVIPGDLIVRNSCSCEAENDSGDC
ncbi:LacI family DNA-binding transcriptional regulator [Candidatus Bipolaricaulota bacterium]|nr:LacI family DNA-binding transcriptional regulator [Candidatus Bipolaricaulota bacterium]